MANVLEAAESEAIAKAYGKLSHFDQETLKRAARQLVNGVKKKSPSSQLSEAAAIELLGKIGMAVVTEEKLRAHG